MFSRHTKNEMFVLEEQSIDNGHAEGDSAFMSGISRITSQIMMSVFRLVVVLAMAGYSVSAVNAAMHPSSTSSASLTAVAQSSHGSHAHDVSSAVDRHSSEADEANTDKSSNTCCQDYCGVFAITCAMPKLAHPMVVSIKDFMNDVSTYGESPRLHRPPNI